MIGEVIVIAAVVAIAFFSGRSTLRSIKAELRGEGTCAGCSGGCTGVGGSGADFAGCSGGCAGCGKTGEACCTCMRQMEELQKLKERKKQCSDSRKEK